MLEDSLVYASSSYIESELYANDVRAPSLPRLSRSSPSASGEGRTPIQGKYIMK